MSEVTICSRTLRGGEELTIKMVSPPLSKDLIDILLKTAELRATERESRMRLFGALRNHSSDCFFAGQLGDSIVGTLWYCTPSTCKETAYMGEVFTDEKHRDKGIATSLLDVAIDNFRKDGGKAIFITNLCPLAPHKIYQKIGFQAYGYGRQDYGGIIRLVLNSKGEDFDLKYFEHDPSTTIREINWGDLPHFTYLLNYPHPWLVRAYSFGLIGFCVFDEFGRSFMNLMHTLKKHNFGFVLENSRHRVVGTAFSSSLQAESQSHVRIVDLLVHPNYLQESTQLLQILCDKLGSEKTEKLQAYASAKDDSKVKTLRACGFRKEATMRRQLRLGEEKVDLQIYSKSFRE